jgi:plasmid stability protein
MATLNIKNFPDRLYRRIKQQRAGKNRRSITQEVVRLLDDAVNSAPRVSLLELEGLGKDVWDKALAGKDAADFIQRERDAWT